MPRSRNIKPAFFKNEDLAELDPAGRLLFIGLWCLADRNGVVEYRPKRIKIELFPYDEKIDINGYITVMERLQLIQLLTDGLNDWLYIPTFTKHQNPHHTEKTNYPQPNELKSKEKTNLTVRAPLSNCYDPADSCLLNPDSCSLIPETGTLIADTSGKPDDAAEILNFLNKTTGKNFKHVESNIKLIKARLKEGHDKNEIMAVINRKTREWENDPKMSKYIRPATLFNAEKFNQYVGDLGIETPEEADKRKMDEWLNGGQI